MRALIAYLIVATITLWEQPITVDDVLQAVSWAHDQIVALAGPSGALHASNEDRNGLNPR